MTCLACGNKSAGFFEENPYCGKHLIQLKRHRKILERTRFDKNQIVESEDYAEIILYDKNQNEIDRTMIDLDDVNKCLAHKWYLKISKGNKRYVQRRIGRLSLTHFLLNFQKDKNIEIDHVNGNTLDNRKFNLRIVTHQENMMNQRVLPSNNTSGYIGVGYNKKTRKYSSQIKINQKRIYLGEYINIEDAISARKNAEIKYFGKNKPSNYEENSYANQN